MITICEENLVHLLWTRCFFVLFLDKSEFDGILTAVAPNVSCEIWLWYPAYAVIDCYLQMHWQVSALCITHIKCYLVNGYEWKICFCWQMIKGRLLHNLASLWDLFSITFTYCYHKTQVSVINRSFTWTSLSLQCILPFILFFSF